MGSETIKSEKELARRIHAPHVVAVGSCTAAMVLSLHVLGVGKGDEVICPSLTWCSTANVVLYQGARPVFCDIDPTTFCVTPDLILEKATSRTRAVIAVRFGGFAVDVLKLRSVLTKHIAIIEDAARAVIPTIITQLLNGESELRLGDTSPTRNHVFVGDTVRAFSALASAEASIGQEVNVATQSEISVGDLAGRLIRLINPEARVVADDQRLRPPKSEVFRLCGSNRKIRELTGWEPAYDIDRGLAETIEWFRQPANLARYKHDIYNL